MSFVRVSLVAIHLGTLFRSLNRFSGPGLDERGWLAFSYRISGPIRRGHCWRRTNPYNLRDQKDFESILEWTFRSVCRRFLNPPTLWWLRCGDHSGSSVNRASSFFFGIGKSTKTAFSRFKFLTKRSSRRRIRVSSVWSMFESAMWSIYRWAVMVWRDQILVRTVGIGHLIC